MWKVVGKIHLGGLFITLLLHSAGRYVVVIADPAIPRRSIVLNCKRIPHYPRNNGALCWLLRLTTSVSREEERSQHDLSFLRSTSDSSTVLPRGGGIKRRSLLRHANWTCTVKTRRATNIYILFFLWISFTVSNDESRMNAKRSCNGSPLKYLIELCLSNSLWCLRLILLWFGGERCL